MSGWSRTVKPSADTTIPSGNIYGVDADEIKATDGIPHIGWAARRVVGSRVLWETLVAMKQPPTPDAADDAILPDARITITTQPQTVSITANAATSFSVVATSTPTVTLSYQWQFSSNAGITYANVSNGGVYANATTATLSLANTVGLAGTLYRVVVSNALANASITSAAANVIFV